MEFKEFFRIVDNFFSYKTGNRYILHEDTKTIECTLYECFVIHLSIGDRYGVFGASIMLDGVPRSLTRILGGHISLNSDKDSIEENLRLIDEFDCLINF